MLTNREEHVCLEARRHGIVLLGPLGRAGAIGTVGGGLLAVGWAPLAVPGAVLVAVAAALALRAVWSWERTQVVVTTEKVFVVEGTWRRRAKAVRLRSVESVELEQSLPGQLLGYGTIVLGPLALENIARPRQVCRLVERLCA